MDIYKFYKYMKNPDKFICEFCQKDNYKYAHLISDKLFVKAMYKHFTGYKLNLKNPVKFNEKLQWLKLYNRNPEYCKYVDKAEVKKYIASKFGEEYIIPTLGVYNSAQEIDFNELPNQFVIKGTHDSGSIVLCKNKNELDIESVKEKLDKQISYNFFWYGREWYYKAVKPRIIIEKAIFDKDGNVPVDYKFFCFNGEMKFVQVDFGRFVDRKSNYYDRELNFQSFHKENCPCDSSVKFMIPYNYDKMVDMVEELSKNIPFVRIDLYNVEGHIFFGEMTFFPGSGCLNLVSEEYDAEKYIGDMLVLPMKRT